MIVSLIDTKLICQRFRLQAYLESELFSKAKRIIIGRLFSTGADVSAFIDPVPSPESRVNSENGGAQSLKRNKNNLVPPNVGAAV